MNKDEEDQLDPSCEKSNSITERQAGQEHPTYNKMKKAKRTGHISRRNCLLKHAFEGNIEQTRRRKHLLHDLK